MPDEVPRCAGCGTEAVPSYRLPWVWGVTAFGRELPAASLWSWYCRPCGLAVLAKGEAAAEELDADVTPRLF